MKKLILHIPHSSTNIPFRDGYIVDDAVINSEILKLTDWFTDDLFNTDIDIIVKADFSRVFCDVERFSVDTHEIMAQFGMGVIYEKADTGELIRKVTPDLRERILNDFYWLHHKELNNSVDMQLNEFGKAVIIDCHSFPNIPFLRDLNQEMNRPDINIGTDKFHTPKMLLDFSSDYFESKKLSVGIDWPYRGSLVPLSNYQINENVKSIMVEINRKLYMNELTGEKSAHFNEIKNIIQDYLAKIRSIINEF